MQVCWAVYNNIIYLELSSTTIAIELFILREFTELMNSNKYFMLLTNTI
jgi:uncharacterized membrane protein SirB2